MSEIAAASSRYFSEVKQALIDKFTIRLAPNKKRLAKALFSVVFLFVIPVWMVHCGYSFLNNQGGLLTAVSEFTDLRIKNVSVGVYHEGKAVQPADWHIQTDHIKNILPFEVGHYILDANPEKVRKAVANVPWVKSATVKLQLPDHVIISIEENIPYALWQVDGVFYLIDEAGDIITDQNLERYDYLPWIVGGDANLYAEEYVMMMRDFDHIFQGIKAAYRVGNRRWTLLTHNDIEISLSEQNPRASLEKLTYLHQKYAILEKEISAIDLRIPTKTFLRKNNDSAMQLFQNKNGQDA